MDIESLVCVRERALKGEKKRENEVDAGSPLSLSLAARDVPGLYIYIRRFSRSQSLEIMLTRHKPTLSQLHISLSLSLSPIFPRKRSLARLIPQSLSPAPYILLFHFSPYMYDAYIQRFSNSRSHHVYKVLFRIPFTPPLDHHFFPNFSREKTKTGRAIHVHARLDAGKKVYCKRLPGANTRVKLRACISCHPDCTRVSPAISLPF